MPCQPYWLPNNPIPIALPELPDLRELAKMASLELSDQEIEDWTPKVHSGGCTRVEFMNS
jgi:hypothetical protein